MHHTNEKRLAKDLFETNQIVFGPGCSIVAAKKNLLGCAFKWRQYGHTKRLMDEHTDGETDRFYHNNAFLMEATYNIP